VRSVPPSLVGIGEVSFLERYAELNMGAKNSAWSCGRETHSRTFTI
jgi:hypothetical protein